MAARLALILAALLLSAIAVAGDVHPITPFLRGAKGKPLVHKNSDRDAVANDGATLVASPAVVVEGGSVNLTWFGTDVIVAGDWISVFCVFDELELPSVISGPNDRNVLDSILLEDEVATAGGLLLDAELVNMGCEYIFRLYRNDTKAGDDGGPFVPRLVATSAPVKMSVPPTGPRHGRLSLSGLPRSVTVTWVSNSVTQKEIVKYGLSSGTYVYGARAHGKGVTYSAGDMCGAPANILAQRWFRNPGYFHTVTLSDLLPGAVYYYRYGNDKDGWSEEASFRAPADIVADANVSFLAFGDMGIGKLQDWSEVDEPIVKEYGDASPTVAALTKEVKTGKDFILHIGDLSYAMGAGYIWDRFDFQIEPIARAAPYLVSVGNHEYDHVTGGEKDPSGAPGIGWHPSWGNFGDDSAGECAVPTSKRFVTPRVRGFGVFWYSFNLGNVHVIQLSSEHDLFPGSLQYAWLKEDLLSVRRRFTPWVVVTAHRPFYNSQNFSDSIEVASHLADAIEDLLFEYQVDLVLSGHVHSYQRSCPVHNDECKENAPVYITAGTAGAYRYPEVGFLEAPWSEFYDGGHYGYLAIDTTEQELQVRFIDSGSGDVVDQVLITRKPLSSPPPLGTAVVIAIILSPLGMILAAVGLAKVLEAVRYRYDPLYEEEPQPDLEAPLVPASVSEHDVDNEEDENEGDDETDTP